MTRTDRNEVARLVAEYLVGKEPMSTSAMACDLDGRLNFRKGVLDEACRQLELARILQSRPGRNRGSLLWSLTERWADGKLPVIAMSAVDCESA